MEEEKLLKALIPAIENIDSGNMGSGHGCPYCISDFVDKANGGLKKINSEWRYHIDYEGPGIDLISKQIR